MIRSVGALLLLAGCAVGSEEQSSTQRDDAGTGAPRDASEPRSDAPTTRDAGDTSTRDAGGTSTRDSGPAAVPDAGPPPMRDAGPTCECTPGATESDSTACGACGEGSRTRTRACATSCRWGSWGSFGACTTSAQCAPGETEAESRSCGTCGLGSQMRVRSCDAATCRWAGWGSWGTCGGGGACAPGATRPCANGDSCGHEVCQSDCTWGGCQPMVECLRIRPGTSGPEGNNWRCCGTSQWQFCLPSCTWSTTCAACSGCGC